MQHLQPNTTLQGGKYIIERVLGQGGFGNTYVGVNTVFNERVAIKEFFMQGINDRDDVTGSITISIERNKQQFQEQLEKFKKEALRIRKLDNPHIVKVHDLFEENGTVYYVMDYVDGENLAERLRRTGKPMTEQEVLVILPQILDALKSVHDAGIWHLDLKPANIMVDKAGNVKLIDFGASKQLNAQKGGATTSTAISYTNGYAPREQMEQNYDKFGPWTDIYALGATLYNLLTNKRPPLPTDIDDDISEDKHLSLPFPDGVSEDMKKLVLELMHTNHRQRPNSVSDIKTLIESSEDEVTIIAYPNKKEEPEIKPIEPQKKKIKTENNTPIPPKPNGSKKWIWRVVAGVIVIGLIVLSSIYYPSNKNNSTAQQVYTDTVDLDAITSASRVERMEYNTAIGMCHYTGLVDSNRLPNDSVGEAYFNDGRFYKGGFVNGVLSGDNCYFKYSNGDVFKGSFKNNAFDRGVYTIAEDGSSFHGSFKNGQPDKGNWFDKNGKVIQ